MKTDSISPIQPLSFDIAHVLLGRTFLDVQSDATDPDYTALERMLETVGGSLLWWQGDYLNHLASARGLEYAEAKAASSYSPGAQKNAAWVCRHVARERRHDALSFSHHAEVAPLSPTDQEIWLDRAEANGWSQKQLRAEIRQSKAKVQNGPEQAPVDQRAARASASFEEFSVWYQSEADGFTSDQREEWDRALEPLVDDWITRNRGHVMLRLKEAAR